MTSESKLNTQQLELTSIELGPDKWRWNSFAVCSSTAHNILDHSRVWLFVSKATAGQYLLSILEYTSNRNWIHVFVESFIYSGYFYSSYSTPLLLRDVPETTRTLCRSFTPRRHRQMRVKGLLKVITRRLEQDLNTRSSNERRRIYQWATTPHLNGAPPPFIWRLIKKSQVWSSTDDKATKIGDVVRGHVALELVPCTKQLLLMQSERNN